MLEDLRAEAQQVLVDLFSEGLIPFALFAGKVEWTALDEYIILFYDSRLYSLNLTWYEDESFKDVFRTAVLQRIRRMSGSLTKKSAYVPLDQFPPTQDR